MKYKVTLFLLFFLMILNVGKSQNHIVPLSVSPGLTIGYTFGKGWNASLFSDIGIIQQKLNSGKIIHGINLTYTLFTHKSEMYESNLYRVLSFNYTCNYDQFAQLKLGVARTRLKWGYNNRNSKGSRWGLNTQIEAMPLKNGALIGFRYFMINDKCMGIGGKEPRLFYTGYQYNILSLWPDNQTNQSNK